MNSKNYDKIFPVWGWIGLGMVFVFWWINWFFNGSRSIWAFFPLWTGCALSIDGFVYYRTATSQISRSIRGFISLFFISAPFWWLFEVFNYRVQNWHYLGVESFSRWDYFLLATINFSTVMPAVFGMAELVASTGLFRKISINLRITKTRKTIFSFLGFGLGTLGLMIIWPIYFFPFMWISLYCILEPINIWLGNAGLADFTENRNWLPVLNLFAGAIITGFFWEFWNFYSYPKWVYTIPFVGYWKIFEMPILGYFGYLPFALELFAIFQIANGFIKNRKAGIYAEINS